MTINSYNLFLLITDLLVRASQRKEITSAVVNRFLYEFSLIRSFELITVVKPIKAAI
ncbi:hypothetical protein SAMN05444355_103109 [Flavobacterium frigoris]|uniref:Uncharacterized protein n=1 Tax=Flavobacterium frigoris TaxID=229204 RepID=A0A1H9HDT5_FLAFI|nr:hypothetical protein SAMN05444355_103109 [Flavobacterium frigoris]